MTVAPAHHPEPGVPELLHRLWRQCQAGDVDGQNTTLNQIGAPGPCAAETVVAALCLGGADFAASLVAGSADDATPDGHAAVLDAFMAVIDAAPDAPADHELRIAQTLIERYVLQGPASALLDIARAEFLITAGPLEEVPDAAVAALRHSQWGLALRGFTRMRLEMQNQVPRNVYGMAAMCLHKLGRYADAEQWTAEGLGEQGQLLSIAPPFSEAELMQRWAGQDRPLVSILCLTYNHERYIENAIRGFLSQDCSFAFEVLIHDDASTDGTQEIVRRWQQRYPNVIKPLLQTENQLSQGRRPLELLLARACGDCVATCEGDDFWIAPAKLQLQVDFLQAHPEFSCSAHNYYHYLETALTVRPYTDVRRDHVLSPRQLMGLDRLLWIPTLVFRKTFSSLPPERALAPLGDQFLTSYLGTQGRCAYFESVLGAVRRENEFSIWSPLPKAEKERRRVQTWAALVCLHMRLGNRQAADDLRAKIAASTLDAAAKAAIVDAAASAHAGMACAA